MISLTRFYSFKVPKRKFWKQCNESGKHESRHDKTNKMSVRPAKTQISLGIRSVWSESSLRAQCVAKDPSFLRWVHRSFCWFCHVAAHILLRCDYVIKLKSKSSYMTNVASHMTWRTVLVLLSGACQSDVANVFHKKIRSFTGWCYHIVNEKHDKYQLDAS